MKVCIIGGGAAGMMAAIKAAIEGNSVTIYEKNEKLGKKLFITGKGRCNLTNSSDIEVIFSNVNRNPKFLYSALYGFDNNSVMDFFSSEGLKLKVERGNRVFPESDHSSDVIKTLEKKLKETGVKVFLNTEVKRLLCHDGKASGIELNDGSKLFYDKIIVATGGLSYPSTGSTGDGYRWAEESGHKLAKPEPSLIPLVSKDEWVGKLQGLSLKNVSFSLLCDGKVSYTDQGEMLFTHFGVSGPLVLSASAFYGKLKEKGKNVYGSIDLKPGLSEEQLDRRLLKDFEENNNRIYANALNELLPQKLIPVIVELSGIAPDKRVNLITREERMTLLKLLKNLSMEISGTRPIDEAIITRGGISVKDINPSTMESKIVKNLYFAGEVIDIDAMTGGYNLQLAWSTGYLAGSN